MRRALLSLLLLTLAFGSYAQKENYIWDFGLKLRADFNSGSPLLSLQPTSFNSFWSSASVCNSVGELLFSSDCKSIYNKNGYPMSNANFPGNGLLILGHGSAYQSISIVPFYGDTTQYYVFTLTSQGVVHIPGMQSTYVNSTLRYSVVDMTLSGGLGNVVAGQKNIPLADSMADKIITVKGAGCYTWVITHKASTQEFLAYKVDANGIHPPVISQPGGVAARPFRFHFGEMKASVDGARLAVCNYWYGIYTSFPTKPDSVLASLELFDFDKATGTVSYPRLIESYDYEPPGHYPTRFEGCAFSPNGNVLYATRYHADTSRVVQYNLNLLPDVSAVSASATVLATADSPWYAFPGGIPTYYDVGYGSLRLGPDNKIYVERRNRFFLERIHQPDVPGPGCNYQKYDLPLPNPGYMTMRGNLGTDVISSRGPAPGAVTDTILCHNTALQLSAPPGHDTYLWSTGATQPTTTVSGASVVWVQYSTAQCVVTDTFHIAVSPLEVSLGADTILCAGNSMHLEPVPQASGSSYLWQDGSTGAEFVATTGGTYWVEASADGCTAADTIHITEQATTFTLGPDVTICSDESVTLSPSGLAPGASTYLWQNGSTNSSLTATKAGTYILTVTQQGCAASDTVEVRTKDCGCRVSVPNAFTPNADGINDRFKPLLFCPEPEQHYRMRVFNRWGEEVFTTSDMNASWDGTFRGKPADIGTYGYLITVGQGSREKMYKGDVALMR